MLIFKMLIAKSMCVIRCSANLAFYFRSGFNPAFLTHGGQNHSGITSFGFTTLAAFNSKILCGIVILAEALSGVLPATKTISWRAMCQKMIRPIFAKLKIFNSVIIVDSIFVMNNFLSREKPSDLVFHYKPVFKHVTSAISTWVFRRFNFYIAIVSSEFLACCKVFSAFSFHVLDVALGSQKQRLKSC